MSKRMSKKMSEKNVKRYARKNGSKKVLEGSGADSRQGSGGLRRRLQPRVLVQIAHKVAEGSGADG